MTCRVVLADDHPLFREGLATALSALPDVAVVGEASDGAHAVELALSLRPDVVVMDLHMPQLTGVEAARRLAKEAPDIAVLVLTMVEGDASVGAALRAGARGYLLKGADRAEIGRALDVVAHGGVYLPAALADRVPLLLGQDAGPEHVFPQLTAREREIFDLVAGGLSNSAIASRLYLSPKTVRNIISITLKKVHARDREHAIKIARDAGLGSSR